LIGAKIDRYVAVGNKGHAPVPVEQNSKVQRVKAALGRALAEQAAQRQAEQAAAAEPDAAPAGGCEPKVPNAISPIRSHR